MAGGSEVPAGIPHGSRGAWALVPRKFPGRGVAWLPFLVCLHNRLKEPPKRADILFTVLAWVQDSTGTLPCKPCPGSHPEGKITTSTSNKQNLQAQQKKQKQVKLHRQLKAELYRASGMTLEEASFPLAVQR
jgi:hypothetical protein